MTFDILETHLSYKMIKTITLSKQNLSIKQLMDRDDHLAAIIDFIGPINYVLHANRFGFLVDTIIGQMLSNRVATILKDRMRIICDGEPTPNIVKNLDMNRLRSIGISTGKAIAISNLTQCVLDDSINLENLDYLSNTDVIKSLICLKGIGVWTAKMFLIFVLNRPDILPFEDRAFLQAYSWLYETTELEPQTIIASCEKWQPHSSYAARYLYKALDVGMTLRPIKDFLI